MATIQDDRRCIDGSVAAAAAASAGRPILAAETLKKRFVAFPSPPKSSIDRKAARTKLRDGRIGGRGEGRCEGRWLGPAMKRSTMGRATARRRTGFVGNDF